MQRDDSTRYEQRPDLAAEIVELELMTDALEFGARHHETVPALGGLPTVRRGAGGTVAGGEGRLMPCGPTHPPSGTQPDQAGPPKLAILACIAVVAVAILAAVGAAYRTLTWLGLPWLAVVAVLAVAASLTGKVGSVLTVRWMFRRWPDRSRSTGGRHAA